MTVFVLFALGTLLGGLFSEGGFDMVAFTRPALVITASVLFCVVVALIVLALRAFRLLSQLVAHYETKAAVRRMRVSFLIVTVIFILRITWVILNTVFSDTVQPDRWLRDNPVALACVQIGFHVVFDYLPLASSLAAFLPVRRRSNKTITRTHSQGSSIPNDRSSLL